MLKYESFQIKFIILIFDGTEVAIRDMDLRLEEIDEENLREIWYKAYREEKPEWKEWDGPYFDDYNNYLNFEDFIKSDEYKFFINENRKCILLGNELKGVVTRYWECKKTLWLNVGIVIFDKADRKKGTGAQALKLWVDETFKAFRELEHIGLVTWSGNKAMIRCAEKIGMRKEAQIRKVRFWQGVYYDSVSYGILRDEFKI